MSNQDKKARRRKITRRAFIITGSVVGGGLAVGIGGGLFYANSRMNQFSEVGMGEGISLNAWVRIRPDGTIAMSVPRAEMGQGVTTSLPMLMAEELEVDLEQIEIIHPQFAPAYTNTVLVANANRGEDASIPTSLPEMIAKLAYMVPYVGTGGSTTIRDAYVQYRVIGAATREMLIEAAADKWNVKTSDCYAESATVINKKTKEKLTYGELAEAASKNSPPSSPELKPDDKFKYVGKSIARLDIPEKVVGQAEFGLDTRVEGMLYAVMAHPPIIGGEIKAVKNKEEVMKMPGVKNIVLIPEGVAVVADNTWRAKNAAAALKLDVDAKGNDKLSSEKIISSLLSAINNGEPQVVAESDGDLEGGFQKAEKTIEAEYQAPYLAHACMEPLNCTVVVKDGKVECWVGHQAPVVVDWAIREATGISGDDVKVNMKYLGGGFGRRAEADYVLKAARVANEMKGTPIQLVYSREEDIQNDTYRPQAISKFKGGIDKDGNPVAWKNDLGIQSVNISALTRMATIADSPLISIPGPGDDTSSAEGAVHLPYDFGSRQTAFNLVEYPIQVGFWRSVGHSQNAFFVESFIDEMAHAAGKDPYEYRAKLLEKAPRFKKLLDKVAEMSNWSQKLPKGKARGIAIHESFGSIAAEVAEVSVNSKKEVKLEKVYCAIDCGKTVNPDNVVSQMESGIVFGLSAAYYGEMTIKDGKFQQNNFPNYKMVKLAVMPDIQVHIMENQEDPGGVGEPGTPPLAPALANAIFAANGERVRDLPLMKHGYKFV